MKTVPKLTERIRITEDSTMLILIGKTRNTYAVTLEDKRALLRHWVKEWALFCAPTVLVTWVWTVRPFEVPPGRLIEWIAELGLRRPSARRA